MQDVVLNEPVTVRSGDRLRQRVMDYLPRGNTLDDRAWKRRHRMLEWVLALHVPGLLALGLYLGHSWATVAEAVTPAVVCLVLGHLVTHRRLASFFITGGLVFCSAALVLISRGSIEAHFHFFIIIGFIALYQDWVPFLWNVAFTVLSHGIGTVWLGGQIFNHPAAQQHPWIWSIIHGVAVLFACVGMVIFWRITEDEQTEKEALGRRLITADAEINRRQFASNMLVNLARRNQSMLYRQLDIINQLEDKERDPDALADLFKVDHLATRIRRNAESLLVLAGEQTPRTWVAPVLLRDVVRASIAETEDLDRVVFAVDDRVAVSGASVADLTHLLAELTENAVRFSPPETAVTIRARPNRRDEGGQLLTVEDWGVGMPRDDLAEANDLLSHPREVDLAVSQRLGFHVVSRLAASHGISVSLSATPGSGITALVVLPAALFIPDGPTPAALAADAGRSTLTVADVPGATAEPRERAALVPVTDPSTMGQGIPVVRNGDGWLAPEPFSAVPADGTGPTGPEGRWRGWWNPEVHGADGAGLVLSTFPSSEVGQGNGRGANGHGSNGHNGNGHAGNGHNGNGHAGNGHNGNGHAGTGHGGNGHGGNGNGFGANGFGGNGFGSPGDGGYRAIGSGAAPNGGSATDHVEQAGSRRDSATDDRTDDGDALFRAAPAVGGGDASPIDDRADADRGAPASPPEPTRRPAPVPDARRVPRPSPAPVGDGGPRPPATSGTRPAASVPAPSMGATAPALPRPRADEPAASELPTLRVPHTTPGLSASSGLPTSSGLPGGRGLRRRVPQSHLAPELRERSHGLADTATPLSADVAATALSRYQASRQAAQAMVDVPDGSRPTDEGEDA